MSGTLLASEIYAMSQNAVCEGNSECHWCAAPCRNLWLHDDPPPVIGIKGRSCARRPNNHFICIGCWLFRRKRVTLTYLDKSYKDGMCPMNYSCLVTPDESIHLRVEDSYSLYKQLLNPPRQFFLALLDGSKEIHLPLTPINSNVGVKAATPIHFSVNNIPMSYTVYELEEALSAANQEEGMLGKEPGVQALIRMFGPYEKKKPLRELKGKIGRPFVNHEVVKSHPNRIVCSGIN